MLVTCMTSLHSNELEKKQLEIRRSLVKSQLQEFARATCLGMYFKKHNYNTEATRSVKGRIFEMGTSSPPRYLDTTALVESYKPIISSMHNLDEDLFKCFIMMHDKDFTSELTKIENKIYSKSDQ